MCPSRSDLKADLLSENELLRRLGASDRGGLLTWLTVGDTAASNEPAVLEVGLKHCNGVLGTLGERRLGVGPVEPEAQRDNGTPSVGECGSSENELALDDNLRFCLA